MQTKWLTNIILFIKNVFCIYCIYFFNILYYKIFYNNAYKCLKKFKEKGIKEFYYSYTLGTLTMDILIILRISRFFYIIFFYIFYIFYIFKIIEIYFLNQFIIFLKTLKIFDVLINILSFHYNLIMKVHILKKNIYLSNKPSKYKFLRRFSVYNTFFFFNVLYLKVFLISLNFIIFDLYLWLFTYYTRFLIKIKYKKKLLIKYNIKKVKNKFYAYFSTIFNKIVNKIFQNYNIKMTIKYYYNKIKKYIINSLNLLILKVKKNLLMIKEFYFIYFVNMLFFLALKNKGNLIFYYIFLFFKYLKSFVIWLKDFYKIYSLEKKKKWK